jgi:hypothetical protein
MSDNPAAAADTHALTVLNTQRRHRYGGSPGRASGDGDSPHSNGTHNRHDLTEGSKTMARSEKVPVRHGDEESAELFPGRDTDVSFDKSDPVNDRAWKGAGDKYVPKEVETARNMHGRVVAFWMS